MGKLSLNIDGGEGPYNITVREFNELSGNRYKGPNPTNNLFDLDIDYIKDNTVHGYIVTASNGSCIIASEIFERVCPCEVLPSFVATQICTNPSDPKISITASVPIASYLRIKIYDSSNVIVHDVISISGTQNFSVNNNSSYRISVEIEGLNNCKAPDQIINVSCQVECNLQITVSNPTC